MISSLVSSLLFPTTKAAALDIEITHRKEPSQFINGITFNRRCRWWFEVDSSERT